MNPWRWASLAGIVFLAIASSFGRIEGIHACNVAPEPILALEFVQTPAEVWPLFPAACRDTLIAAQRAGLWLDIIGFVAVYSALLILTLLALGRENPGKRGLVRAGIALTIVAALADQWENAHLLAIIAALPGDQPTIDALIPAVRIKFVLLSLVELLVGALHLLRPGWRKLAGAVIGLGAIIGLAGLFGNHAWLQLGGTIAFVAIIAADMVLALRRR